MHNFDLCVTTTEIMYLKIGILLILTVFNMKTFYGLLKYQRWLLSDVKDCHEQYECIYIIEKYVSWVTYYCIGLKQHLVRMYNFHDCVPKPL